MIYSNYPGLLFGFHGCRKEVYDSVIRKSRPLTPSCNSYDWLGSGIYFWENSYSRAFDWARSRYANEAAVIGAALDLGYCLNLTDYQNSEYIREGYIALKAAMSTAGMRLPQNKSEM